MKESLFSKKSFWIFFLLFNLTVLPILFFIGQDVSRLRRSAEPSSLPVFGALRPFTLKEMNGADFTRESLKNRVWVANFMFTSCPNECPAMNFKMGLLQDALQGHPGLLSFSVDPEKDSPEVLRSYADKFKAKKDVWYFLTGAKETIGRVMEDCHFANTGNPLTHGLRLVLLDGEGRIRGYYDYSDESMVKKLAHDIRLLKEKG